MACLLSVFVRCANAFPLSVIAGLCFLTVALPVMIVSIEKPKTDVGTLRKHRSFNRSVRY